MGLLASYCRQPWRVVLNEEQPLTRGAVAGNSFCVALPVCVCLHKHELHSECHEITHKEAQVAMFSRWFVSLAIRGHGGDIGSRRYRANFLRLAMP